MPASNAAAEPWVPATQLTHHAAPGRTEGKCVNAFYETIAEWFIHKSLTKPGELQHSTWTSEQLLSDESLLQEAGFHLDIIGIRILCPNCSWRLLLRGHEARHVCPLNRLKTDALLSSDLPAHHSGILSNLINSGIKSV